MIIVNVALKIVVPHANGELPRREVESSRRALFVSHADGQTDSLGREGTGENE